MEVTEAACPLLLPRPSCRMTVQPSGKLYTAVTKYWSRIADGLRNLTYIAVASRHLVWSETTHADGPEGEGAMSKRRRSTTTACWWQHSRSWAEDEG